MYITQMETRYKMAADTDVSGKCEQTKREAQTRSNVHIYNSSRGGRQRPIVKNNPKNCNYNGSQTI